MVYHKRAFYNCFISCLRKYSDQRNQCGIRAMHDGKVGCNTVEYKTAFLFSDWLYFPRNLIKNDIRKLEIKSNQSTMSSFNLNYPLNIKPQTLTSSKQLPHPPS